ncbi:anaphase-promoting complex subunit cdc27 [Tieghemiomyces parasiticus]|uniref:Anaphase-promoting complex subunit cdc27 n=1 Tax=Tieghemiomyces parasiticus TaxID=78921 RepID=A0A9W8ADN7_9FUNG|nr:anaphase-promoting complex subunit cdc27 [Tieghemiomyces parasiticus]
MAVATCHPQHPSPPADSGRLGATQPMDKAPPPLEPLAVPSCKTTQTAVHQQLARCIEASLAHRLDRNALFYAEQWFALEPAHPRALGYLALCYHRLHGAQACHTLLVTHASLLTAVDPLSTSTPTDGARPSMAAQSRAACTYLLACACIELRRWSEAEHHLNRLITPGPDSPAHAPTRSSQDLLSQGNVELLPQPTPAAVHYHLGVVNSRYHDLDPSTIFAPTASPLPIEPERLEAATAEQPQNDVAPVRTRPRLARPAANQSIFSASSLPRAAAALHSVVRKRLSPSPAGGRRSLTLALTRPHPRLPGKPIPVGRRGTSPRGTSSRLRPRASGSTSPDQPRRTTAPRRPASQLPRRAGRGELSASIGAAAVTQEVDDFAPGRSMAPETGPVGVDGTGEPGKKRTRAASVCLVSDHAVPVNTCAPVANPEAARSSKSFTRSASADAALELQILRAPDREAGSSGPPRPPPPVYLADRFVAQLLVLYATGYAEAARYQCRSAIHHFSLLPTPHQMTPRVMAQFGRLHFELGDYARSEQCFAWSWQHHPYRVTDLDRYSTLLWHAQSPTALGHLAHTLTTLHRGAPQAWCTAGNAFSLQQRPVQALQCFERAIQLDPDFVYAYTLAGHEHLAHRQPATATGGGAWDQEAARCFRAALRLDPRHYNAWYGLGMLHHQLGQAALAEYHFGRALAIYPANPTLLCCLGMVAEQLGNLAGALDHYDAAIRMADVSEGRPGVSIGNEPLGHEDTSTAGSPSPTAPPQAVFARFKRAKVLVALERYQEALAELESLKPRIPNEANVYFLAAQIYQHLRQTRRALLHYAWALDLDPQASHTITEAMENLRVQASDGDDGNEGDGTESGRDGGEQAMNDGCTQMMGDRADGGSGATVPDTPMSREVDEEFSSDWAAMATADGGARRAFHFD